MGEMVFPGESPVGGFRASSLRQPYVASWHRRRAARKGKDNISASEVPRMLGEFAKKSVGESRISIGPLLQILPQGERKEGRISSDRHGKPITPMDVKDEVGQVKKTFGLHLSQLDALLAADDHL
jgi:hypothetical protein